MRRLGLAAAAGTGLGMSIVKHTIEAHGGETCMESEFGEGTSIHFTLPLDSKEETDASV